MRRPQTRFWCERIIGTPRSDRRLAAFAFAVSIIAVVVGPTSARGSETVDNATDAKSRQLNVLFLVSDDLRPELGCYGTDAIKTPNIDRLSARGVTFLRAYCQQAVCSPSRTSVMTGTRPDTNRVWNLTTHFREALPDVVTLPQLFKQHGYVAKGLGKIYHGAELDDHASWSIPDDANNPNDSAAVPDKATIVAKRKQQANRKRGPAFRASDDPPNGGGDGRLADEAIATLRELKTNTKPFFLAVGFRKPHLPFSVPKHYWDLYEADAIPLATNRFLPKGAPDYALVDRNEMWKYQGVPDESHFTDDYARQLKHGYYAAVSYMDAQLGRVVNELDQLALSENTIIVLWGDHGWKLGEHDRWCKHSNVEDDTRSPLIISTPGMSKAGHSTERLVEFVDIYPTVASLAGLPTPSHLEGISLTPLLDEPERQWKSAAFSQYPRTVKGKQLMGYSMRTNRYRFTRWVGRDDPKQVNAIELYDHQLDPQENTNVANEAANEDLVDRLTQQWLAGWQGATRTATTP